MIPVRVVVIGGGPGGMAAALQLQRQGCDPVLYERGELGGLLRNANRVENYPGFPQGVSGLELVGRMVRGIERVGVSIRPQEVTRLDWDGSQINLWTDGDERIDADAVVIATGTEALMLPVDQVSEAVQGKVFTEVVPLRSMRGGRVAVIGGGDAAFDYALQLGRHNRVEIHMRGENPRALPLLVERVRRHSDIDVHRNSMLHRATDSGDEGVRCSWRTGDRSRDGRFDAVLVAIGREPLLPSRGAGLLEAWDRLAAAGRLAIIGDVAHGRHRQASIAVGDGIREAMGIAERWSG